MEKYTTKSLNLDFLILDFEWVQAHNNHVRERILF